MSPEVHEKRLRNWALAYQRLMRGGLGIKAHTACVDDFIADDGTYPYITAADVLVLLDDVADYRDQIARARQALDPEEFECGRLGLPCTEVNDSGSWCRACRLRMAFG